MVSRLARQTRFTESLERRSLLAVAGPHYVDFTIELPTNSSSDRVIQADINGDGMLDLVSFRTLLSGKIYSFAGYENGTFGPATLLFDLAGADDIVPGDFNNDGRDDLLVLGATPGGVDLLLSTPSGIYLKSRVITGDQEMRIGVADFDSDGNADIVSTTFISGPASAVLLRGNGDGTFQPAVQLSPDLDHAVFVGAADLDEDGVLDLLLRSAFLHGRGDGTFETRLFSASYSYTFLADATGDGRLDIVSSDNTTLTVMPGLGDGTFAPSISSPTRFGTPSVTDFDRDGEPDVIVVLNGSAYLQRGLGDGTFESPVELFFVSGSFGRTLVSDLNQDGTADFVNPGLSNELSLHFGDGTGGVLPVEMPRDRGAQTIAVDLNGDRREDLVTYYGIGVRVRLQNADGSFGVVTGSPTVSSGALAQGDVDNDGDIDLAVVARPESHLFRNNGDGTFIRTTINSAPSGIMRQSFMADFNGDGADDLFVALNTGFFISISNGDGTFAPMQLLGVNGERAVAADLNGDGAIDLAYAYYNSPLQTLLGNGDGTFRAGQSIAVEAGTSSGLKLFAGQFNSDPFIDVVMTKGSRVCVFAGKADGTLDATRTTVLAVAPRVFISDDVDSDGLLELVTVGDHPFVLDIRDDGIVVPVTPFEDSITLSSSGLFAMSDVNNDGKRDVLVTVTDLVTPPYVFLNVGRTVAPSLLDARYDVDSRKVSFRFDAPLLASSVGLADLDMTAASSGAQVDPTSVSLSTDGRTVLFTLPVSIPDGEYHITIRAGAVTSVDGLQSTSDATMPSQRSFILAGDLNRDRTVNFDDLLTLAQNYGQTGKTFSQGNIDYSADGLVGFDDLLILAQRYGTSLVSSRPASMFGNRKRHDPLSGLTL